MFRRDLPPPTPPLLLRNRELGTREGVMRTLRGGVPARRYVVGDVYEGVPAPRYVVGGTMDKSLSCGNPEKLGFP